MATRYKIVGRQYNSRNCIVCGLHNEIGLKAAFFETESNELIAVCTPRLEHQSYPNRLHGGISAALLDEVIGRAMCIGNPDMVWGVTLDLAMKYRKPVPYGVEIKIIGRITKDRGRMVEGTGEIYLPGGELAVSASGLYMKQPVTKITDGNFDESDEWGLLPDCPMPDYIDI